MRCCNPGHSLDLFAIYFCVQAFLLDLPTDPLRFRAEIEEFMRFALPAGRAGIPSQNAAQKQQGWARIRSQNYRQEFRAGQQVGPEFRAIWFRGLQGEIAGPTGGAQFPGQIAG
jgi:hypothetical protein